MEILSKDDLSLLIEQGSDQKCKELGLTRIEGKDYVMQDDDVVVFRFNV